MNALHQAGPPKCKKKLICSRLAKKIDEDLQKQKIKIFLVLAKTWNGSISTLWAASREVGQAAFKSARGQYYRKNR